MTGTHVVTGATGLVGGALVIELLRRTDARIVCPTRAHDSEPQRRLSEALRAAARGYGHGDSLDGQIEARCLATPFDLGAPRCGVDPGLVPGGAEQFWHCAADLSYEDKYWESLQRTNIAGTGNALDLARALGCETYNQVSTAYVAGRRTGILMEEPADECDANNRYEQSKTCGEALVAAADLRVRILRPSIVIGHSVTKHVAGGLSGAYSVQDRLARLQRRLARAGTTVDLRVRLRADPTVPINFVPVDLVVADAVSLGLTDATGIFHLTHPTPLPLGSNLDLICELVGLEPPQYCLDGTAFTGIDRLIERQMDFYQSYWTGTKVFDQSRLHAAVPTPALTTWTLDTADLTEFYLWHLRHLGHPAREIDLASA
ncbi:SDR family oxidoreductase [Streptomyces sp. YS-3]|uniref:SDR family oxidoreductase n=1 Tax=Streptomyces sp. YS-3 TaxID=3381352 RepID=UPI003862CE2C